MATLLVLLAVAIVLRYGLSEPWRARLRRAVMPALLVGGLGFALGFFGPMIFAPGANQGPMLGIFITGPLGFLAGLLWGVGREVLRRDRPR